jgi:tungstate transport system substrate-binding protein
MGERVWLETAAPPVLGKEIRCEVSLPMGTLLLSSSAWQGGGGEGGQTMQSQQPRRKTTVKHRKLFSFFVISLVLALLVGCKPTPTSAPPAAAAVPEVQKLVLATTTSTYDSGLLDYLLPDFEGKYNAEVEVMAVGTGQAIKIAETGDADLILVHSRVREDKLVAEGYGVNRRDVMYNDFVILGPEDDPAGISGMTDAAAAFSRIAEAQAPFASRGDESGTHGKEKAIWEKAGLEPGGDWYLSLGQGMGATLTFANEKGAYTLADRGTYLSRKEGLGLSVLVEGDAMQFNPYGVIAVSPEKWSHVSYELAMQFIEWLTSMDTQGKIGQFRHPSGELLFHPNSEQWQAAGN